MADESRASGLQRDTWEAAAPGWARWEHAFTACLSRATDVLLDMAGVRPGLRVLDVACGAGSQSIRAAERVGPTGEVLASDISGTMLEHVRRNAARAGLENIETLECAADELSTALAPFDAAICRMALMLFPSPATALEAVRQVLKPGARVSALVFTTPARSPFLAQPMAILLRHAGKAAPAPGSPGIFALGADGVLEDVMKAAGFAGVEMRTLTTRLVLPGAREALHLMQEAAGAYRAVVAALDAEAKGRAWNEVHDCLKQFESGRGFETELEVLVGAGVRPG